MGEGRFELCCTIDDALMIDSTRGYLLDRSTTKSVVPTPMITTSIIATKQNLAKRFIQLLGKQGSSGGW